MNYNPPPQHLLDRLEKQLRWYDTNKHNDMYRRLAVRSISHTYNAMRALGYDAGPMIDWQRAPATWDKTRYPVPPPHWLPLPPDYIVNDNDRPV